MTICRLVTVGSIILALSGNAAWADRTVTCLQGQWDKITIRQEPTGYHVTIRDQPMETSVIFETPDRRQVVLSAITHPSKDAIAHPSEGQKLDPKEFGLGQAVPQPPVEVSIVTVNFQNLKVESYTAFIRDIPLGAVDLLSGVSPIVKYQGCLRLD